MGWRYLIRDPEYLKRPQRPFTKTGAEHCRLLDYPHLAHLAQRWMALAGENRIMYLVIVLISFLWDGQINSNGLSFLSHSWSVPFALSCICLFLQTIHFLLHSINTFRKPVIEIEPSLTDTTAFTFSRSLAKIKSFGGWTIYLFMVARLFGCLLLFTFSIDSLLRCQKNHPGVDTNLFVGCTS